MMQKVQTVLPQVRILSGDDYIMEERCISTTKANGYAAEEVDWIFTLKEDHAVRNDEGLFDLGFVSCDPWKSYRYFINEDASLPRAVVVGDSFTWMFMLEDMAQSFSELAFIHYNDLSQLNRLIAGIQPDVVIGAFLSNAIVMMKDWSYETVASQAGVLPVAAYLSEDYHYLDYINAANVYEQTLEIDGSEEYELVGWAVDPLAKAPAGGVTVQVGEKLFSARYGEPRESVAAYFGIQQYLNSGYKVVLDAEAVNAASKIQIHVLSADGTYQYPPVVLSVRRTMDASADPLALPENGYTQWGFHYMDYCSGVPVAQTIALPADGGTVTLVGWALDPQAGTTAGAVFLQIGDELLPAQYGLERDTVAQAFGNAAYVNCGYSLDVEADKLARAGQVTVHVISADGACRYPPQMYPVQRAP